MDNLKLLSKRLQRAIDRAKPNTLPTYQYLSIDEFLCPVCDAFIGSNGCLIHPTQGKLL